MWWGGDAISWLCAGDAMAGEHLSHQREERGWVDRLDQVLRAFMTSVVFEDRVRIAGQHNGGYPALGGDHELQPVVLAQAPVNDQEVWARDPERVQPLRKRG